MSAFRPDQEQPTFKPGPSDLGTESFGDTATLNILGRRSFATGPTVVVSYGAWVTTDLTLDMVLLRLALDFAAAFLLAWNREELGHPAGMRTIVLLCLAACTAMLLGSWLLTKTKGDAAGLSRLDLMRLPQGILAGIGFIGAGTILKQGGTVRGVTTAATVWLTTVVGLCFGAGGWRLGMATTLISLATLLGLGLVERRLRRRSYGTVTLSFDTGATSHAALLRSLRAEGLVLRSSTLEQGGGKGTLRCVGAHRGSNPD